MTDTQALLSLLSGFALLILLLLRPATKLLFVIGVGVACLLAIIKLFL